jgi:membrane associated rhomboid family serine protease
MYNSRNPYQMQPKEYWLAVRRFFEQKSALSNLILVNILVFLIINLVSLVFYLFSIDQGVAPIDGVYRLTYWLSLPADPANILLKPWTLITFMFVQQDLFHLLFNLMVLYVGGQIFINYLSSKMLVTTYFLGGLSGALVYILSYNFFPAFSTHLAISIAYGSSASALAIFAAAATWAPELNMQVFLTFKVRLKYLALIIIFLDVLNIQHANPGGHLAHLGGALYGFLFALNLKKGKNIGSFFENLSLQKAFSWFKKPKPKFKNVYSNPRPSTDEDYLRRRAEEQARIDSILEKIKKSGYVSLSAEEKAILFKASNKN